MSYSAGAGVADVRIHGTSGEQPIERFLRDEVQVLRPLGDKAPFVQVRELVRRVHSELVVLLSPEAILTVDERAALSTIDAQP